MIMEGKKGLQGIDHSAQDTVRKVSEDAEEWENSSEEDLFYRLRPGPARS